MVCGRGGIYGLQRGVRTFGGLGLQGCPDESLVSNIFESSFTEDGTVPRNAIFEVEFNFAVSEARKKFYSTASADRGAIW